MSLRRIFFFRKDCQCQWHAGIDVELPPSERTLLLKVCPGIWHVQVGNQWPDEWAWLLCSWWWGHYGEIVSSLSLLMTSWLSGRAVFKVLVGLLLHHFDVIWGLRPRDRFEYFNEYACTRYNIKGIYWTYVRFVLQTDTEVYDLETASSTSMNTLVLGTILKVFIERTSASYRWQQNTEVHVPTSVAIYNQHQCSIIPVHTVTNIKYYIMSPQIFTALSRKFFKKHQGGRVRDNIIL